MPLHAAGWSTATLNKQKQKLFLKTLRLADQDSILCITGGQNRWLGQQLMRFRHNQKRLRHAACCWCLLTCLRDELLLSIQLYRLIWYNITGCYVTVTGGKGYTDKSLLEQSHPGRTTKQYPLANFLSALKQSCKEGHIDSPGRTHTLRATSLASAFEFGTRDPEAWDIRGW